ncbi:MAG TPA: Trm112 family protein [Anaeromyxobacteraceae bacterium]|nr:Trm112 family protein [Anaeromyxobacteraceae bacterium]
MALSPDLKEILACPRCKGDLEFHEERNEIHCLRCRLVFRIDDGIPVMLLEEARPLGGPAQP